MVPSLDNGRISVGVCWLNDAEGEKTFHWSQPESHILVLARKCEVVSLRIHMESILALGMYFFPHMMPVMPNFSSLLFTAAVICLLSKWNWSCTENEFWKKFQWTWKPGAEWFYCWVLRLGNRSVLGFPSEWTRRGSWLAGTLTTR